MVPATMTKVWASLGSSIASFLIMWAIISQYSPYEIRHISHYYNPYFQISIHEFVGGKYQKHSQAYDAVEACLSFNSIKSAKKLGAKMENQDGTLVLSLNDNEVVTDEFLGVEVLWSLTKIVSSARSGSSNKHERIYDLTFHQRYREMMTEKYISHVLEEGMEIIMRNRQRKLHSNCGHWLGSWSHIVFKNPVTYETMALDPKTEKEIIDDLLAFSRNKDFCANAGEAWKRRFLLYRSPGTGKSTMVATITNLLGYDTYDLKLTAVRDNTELRRLLIGTTSKSIIVIEDIHCSLDLTGQRKKNAEKSSEEEKRTSPIRERKKRKKETAAAAKSLFQGF